jgi:hypothetical protein
MARPLSRSSRPRLAGDELTDAKIEYLLLGRNDFAFGANRDQEAFENERDARECWHEHRSTIIGLKGFGWLHYRPGTRPWAYWRFDRRRDVPRHEAHVLLIKGEMSANEQAEVLRTARQQFTNAFYCASVEYRARALLVSDEILLHCWPNISYNLDKLPRSINEISED